MKSISNSDFSLIAEKLPAVLRLAKSADTLADLQVTNALRKLDLLARKFNRNNNSLKITKNSNKNGTVD